MNNQTNWNTLKENGYIVLPILDQKKLKYYMQKMQNDLIAMPEFKTGYCTGYVMGGFAALGNASSFHLPFVRELRLEIHTQVYNDLFKPALDEDKDLKFEQIIDRVMHRTPLQKVNAESWHRDESPCDEGDEVFGGWINLDNNNQYFSGCPGTHKYVSKHNGFAKIKKEEFKEYQRLQKTIEIPPGHIFIFYEKMVHEVKRSKKKYVNRLFTGWRLTKSDQCIHGNENLRKMLKEKAIIPLKSGQIPPMYAKLHFLNWVEKIVDFTQIIDEKCIETRQIKSGRKAGVYRLVHRFMKSLKELDMDIYPEYEEREIEILIPHRY